MKLYRLRLLPLAAALLLAACSGPDTPPESSGGPTAGGTAAASTAPTLPPTTSPTTPPTTLPTAYRDPETGVIYEGWELTGERAEDFELPLEGATGFASIETAVYASPEEDGSVVALLSPGDAFTIREERDARWWRIERDGLEDGWVDNTCCYLNIPDVVPSIVIDNTNAYASAYVSSGKAIPGITGEVLYASLCWNERFGGVRYVAAANYIMVKKIYAAQQAALAEGYTLVVNETFRPYDVQLNIAAELKKLYLADPEVKAGIDRRPWSIGWFIASRMSTHQIGCAMDVTLAKVRRVRYRLSGGYRYAEVAEYEVCVMPTPIHELSAAAVSLEKPVSSSSPTAWREVEPAPTMTEDALRLKRYCTQAGLSPLASEWWHFNDLEAKEAIGDGFTTEVFYLAASRSRIPE